MEKKKFYIAFGWRRLLRVPWTARRSNQSIPKEINPEYSWEGLMLKLLYFGHLRQRAESKTFYIWLLWGWPSQGRDPSRHAGLPYETLAAQQ